MSLPVYLGDLTQLLGDKAGLALLDSAPMGLCVIDREFRIRAANRRASAICQSLAPLVDRDFRQIVPLLFPPLVHSDVLEQLHRVAANSTAASPPDDEADWQIVPVQLSDGSPGAACLFSGALRLRSIEGMDAADGRSESEVRESESRLRLATAAGRVGIGVWDIRANVIKGNTRLAELFGVDPEAARIGLPREALLSHLHPEDVPRAITLMAETLEGGTHYVIEYRVAGHDGRFRWIQTRAQLERDSEGNPLRFPGTAIDITELKEAEDALRKSEARLQLALQTLRAGTIDVDLSTNHVSFDQRTAEFLQSPDTGLTLDEGISRFVHPEDRVRVRDDINSAIAGTNGGHYTHRWRHVRPDGSTRWIHLAGQVFFDGEGDAARPVRLLSALVDVTEQREHEEAIRTSEERVRMAMESARMCSWEINIDTGALDVSGTFTDIFGIEWQFPSPDWIAVAAQLIPPRECEQVTRALIRNFQQDGQFQMEFGLVNPRTGEEQWVSVHGLVLQRTEDRPRRALGIAQNITARKQAEAALRESQAALKEADQRKDVFLATLAHELRNPLAPIRTGLELIRLAGDAPAAVGRVRAMMERQVVHMVRLIDDLLDVSRITSGKIRLERGPSPLATLVNGAIEANRTALTTKRLELSVELPEQMCVLDVDPTRFIQVISNLLHNAVKFTHTGGQIRLSAEVVHGVPHPQLVMSVTDTGIGIAPDLLPHVFDLFTQGDGDSARPGLGIGLALARRIVEMHGGLLSADSVGLGRGSTFVVRMPISTEQPPPEPEPVGQHAYSRRVIVIDDSEDAARATAMLVEQLGGEARIALDGESGVREAVVYRPDIVLLDIRMPELDGWETCRRLRRALGDEVTIVALTGFGQAQDKELAAQCGFDAHLTKPAEATAIGRLLSATSRHLDTSD